MAPWWTNELKNTYFSTLNLSLKNSTSVLVSSVNSCITWWTVCSDSLRGTVLNKSRKSFEQRHSIYQSICHWSDIIKLSEPKPQGFLIYDSHSGIAANTPSYSYSALELWPQMATFFCRSCHAKNSYFEIMSYVVKHQYLFFTWAAW